MCRRVVSAQEWETRGYVCNYRNCGGDWRHRRRLLDGAREFEGADSAGGTGDYWRGGDWDGADCESAVYFEEDCRRAYWCVWRITIHKNKIFRDAEDAFGVAY